MGVITLPCEMSGGAGCVDGVGRPATGTLSGVLDAHREVEPVEYMINGPGVAASPRDRGPSAPSLRIVTSVASVMPRPVSKPFSCVRCRSASPGTPLNRTGFPSSLLTWAAITSNVLP